MFRIFIKNSLCSEYGGRQSTKRYAQKLRWLYAYRYFESVWRKAESFKAAINWRQIWFWGASCNLLRCYRKKLEMELRTVDWCRRLIASKRVFAFLAGRSYVRMTAWKISNMLNDAVCPYVFSFQIFDSCSLSQASCKTKIPSWYCIVIEAGHGCHW